MQPSLEEILSKSPEYRKLALQALDRADCQTLAGFVKRAWHILEPSRPYIHNWHIDAMCEHLESVTNGDIKDLLINVPPGALKSLLVSVFWPAWMWGPYGQPGLRFITASHAQSLAIRDSTKMRRLILSDWYQELWGAKAKEEENRLVILTGDQNSKLKFENTRSGFREACAAGSMTGARGDFVILDDAHSVSSAASQAERESTAEWFLEAVPTRVNNHDDSHIVVIMQRLHEEDISGIILSKQMNYEHLMIPMEFEKDRKCYTSIGWEDPRTEDGELMFPELFSAQTLAKLRKSLGEYGWAGQMQQRPAPRGGGIIKRAWWKLWDDETAQANGVTSCEKYPDMEFVIMSVDTAYTEKQENDPAGLQVWGVWHDKNNHMRLMLMYAWSDRLDFNPLMKKLMDVAKRFRVDRILIEAKASGISIAQEIRRLSAGEDYGVTLLNPGSGDKVARLVSISHFFENGLVYCPDEVKFMWADQVISQIEAFPKAKHDEHADCTAQALNYLRSTGILQMPKEIDDAYTDSITHKGRKHSVAERYFR